MKNQSIATQVALLLVAIVSSTSGVCVAQPVELEKFISKNCAAFVVVEEPAAFLESLGDSLFFSSSRVSRAFEILRDDQYEVLNKKDLVYLENWWQDFAACLSGLESLSVIVYPDETSGIAMDPDWLYMGADAFPRLSIVLKGKPDRSQRLEKLIINAQSDARKSLADDIPPEIDDDEVFQPSNESPEESEAQRDDGTREADSTVDDFQADSYDRESQLSFFAKYMNRFLDAFIVRREGDLVVVSNDEVFTTQFLQRASDLSNKNFRSLSRHRSYQMIKGFLEKRSDSPVIRGFFVPERFSTQATDAVTKSLNFNSQTLRAGGFMISLESDDGVVDVGSEQYRRVVEWDSVMTFAEPAVEYGKIVQSFLPIENLPALPNPIAELAAIGFDSQLRHDAFNETIQIHRPEVLVEEDDQEYSDGQEVEGDADSENEDDEFQDEYDEFQDEYKEFNDFEIYTLVGESKQFDPSSVVGFSNSRYEAWITDPVSKTSHWLEIYRVTDMKQMEAFFKARVDAENRDVEIKQYFVETDSKYGRLFARNPEMIRNRARNFRQEEFGNEPASVNVDPMQFETEFFLNDQWMICTDSITMQIVLKAFYEDDVRSSKFNQILNAARQRLGNREPVKISYHSVEHDEDDIESEQLFLLKQSYLEAGRDEEYKDALEAGPDEFGHYGKIETRDDAFVAIRQLLTDEVKEMFGTSISLSHVGDHTFHVFGQFYSKSQ